MSRHVDRGFVRPQILQGPVDGEGLEHIGRYRSERWQGKFVRSFGKEWHGGGTWETLKWYAKKGAAKLGISPD